MRTLYDNSKREFTQGSFAKVLTDPAKNDNATRIALELAEKLAPAYKAHYRNKETKLKEIADEKTKLEAELDKTNQALNELKDTQYKTLLEKITKLNQAIERLEQNKAELEQIKEDTPGVDESAFKLQTLKYKIALQIFTAQKKLIDDLFESRFTPNVYFRKVGELFAKVKQDLEKANQTLRDELDVQIERTRKLLNAFTARGNDISFALAQLPSEKLKFNESHFEVAERFRDFPRPDTHFKPVTHVPDSQAKQTDELQSLDNIETIISLAMSERNTDVAVLRAQCASSSPSKLLVQQDFEIKGSKRQERLLWNPEKSFLENLKINLQNYPGGLFRYSAHKKAVAHILRLIPKNIPNDAAAKVKIAEVVSTMADYLRQNKLTPIGRNGKQSYVYSLFVFAILRAYEHYEQFEQNLSQQTDVAEKEKANEAIREEIETAKASMTVVKQQIGFKEAEQQTLTDSKSRLKQACSQLEAENAAAYRKVELREHEILAAQARQAEALEKLRTYVVRRQPHQTDAPTLDINAMEELAAQRFELLQARSILTSTTLTLLGYADTINPQAYAKLRGRGQKRGKDQIKAALLGKQSLQPIIDDLSSKPTQESPRPKNPLLQAFYGI